MTSEGNAAILRNLSLHMRFPEPLCDIGAYVPLALSEIYIPKLVRCVCVSQTYIGGGGEQKETAICFNGNLPLTQLAKDFTV